MFDRQRAMNIEDTYIMIKFKRKELKKSPFNKKVFSVIFFCSTFDLSNKKNAKRILENDPSKLKQKNESE